MPPVLEADVHRMVVAEPVASKASKIVVAAEDGLRRASAVIIVGTPDWSSFGVSGSGGRASTIVANPVNASNILYTFHFYAASHLQEYRNELIYAAQRLPVFVTEWGSQEYTGDGPNNFSSTQQYIDIMAQYKISWTSWNYSDDARSGANRKEHFGQRGDDRDDPLRRAQLLRRPGREGIEQQRDDDGEVPHLSLAS